MATRQPLFIFDPQDRLQAITTDYRSAVFDETVQSPVSLTIEIPLESPDAGFLVTGSQVAFKDLEDRLRLFTIRETDDTDGDDYKKIAYAYPGINELTDVMVEERTPQDQPAAAVLTTILAASRWNTGNVADLGLKSSNFYFENALVCLQRLLDTWGGEAVDRIEITGNQITGRYIDIVLRKGADTGKRFEVDKDITNITRTVLFYPKTALYGKGSSVEKGAGYSRKITFATLEKSTAAGDDFDKPLGQEWVGDEAARLLYGIPDGAGGYTHRYGLFEDSQETDPEQLLLKTWAQVQASKEPKIEYKMAVRTFYGISGYEHEAVHLGDTGIARDQNIKPAILVEARVLELKYDIGDPESGELTLGNILAFDADEKQLEWVVGQVKENGGIWDQGGTAIVEVTDGSFPDTAPATPQGLTATGLFKTIQLDWIYQTASYIAAYELYGSQVDGFIPDSTNLLWRGKAGGTYYKADINQQWYFRLRAVNYAGTASAYTEQVTAATLTIDAEDITPHVITNELIAENAEIDGAKIAEATITDAHITGTLSANKIAVGSTTTYELGYDPSTKEKARVTSTSPPADTDVIWIDNSDPDNIVWKVYDPTTSSWKEGPGGQPGEDAWHVEIISTNGTFFRPGTLTTTLDARVYKGGVDVTESLDASRFKWRRVSDDPAADQIWTDRYFGGTKAVTLTTDDVASRATFFCEII